MKRTLSEWKEFVGGMNCSYITIQQAYDLLKDWEEQNTLISEGVKRIFCCIIDDEIVRGCD